MFTMNNLQLKVKFILFECTEAPQLLNLQAENTEVNGGLSEDRVAKQHLGNILNLTSTCFIGGKNTHQISFHKINSDENLEY